MTWLNVYTNIYRSKIDEMVLEDLSAEDIYDFLQKKSVEGINLEDIEDYIDNWFLAVLKDAYIDYLWLYNRLKGVKMAEYEENDLFQEGIERNKFILDSIIARTLYRINHRYKDKGMDDKTFKELNQLILTTLDKIGDLNKKSNPPSLSKDKEPVKREVTVDNDISDSKTIKAITKSDLESYLLSKSTEEQKVIKQFIADLKNHFTIINLEDYVHKSKVEN